MVAIARAFKILKTTVSFVHHMLFLIKAPFGIRLYTGNGIWKRRISEALCLRVLIGEWMAIQE